jgi:hypothetical protein
MIGISYRNKIKITQKVPKIFPNLTQTSPEAFLGAFWSDKSWDHFCIY